MFREDKKNTQKKKILFSTLGFLFFGGFFFHFGLGDSSPVVSAASLNPLEWVGDVFTTGLKGLLYGVFVVVTWIAAVAVSLFGWAVDPNYISGTNGFLNRQVIYDLWKFVRDFFNLFFILVLLYLAFTIIFQVAKDYKKTLLQLVIMALLVNFSFPISRFLIDATNVPMYFFLNQALPSDQGNPGVLLGTALRASQLEAIILPGKIENMGVAHMMVSIAFVFVFAITLLVLAVMFVVRLIALIILVIFSSVGFACTFIPGLEKYSGQWWESFWKYALFGPAAALMLLVALKFMATMGEDFLKVKEVAVHNTAVTEPGFIASMAFFSVPIILLWFAMGIANSFSVAGAGTVVGIGEKIAKWTGRQVTITPAIWAERKYEKGATAGFGFKGISGLTKWLAPETVYKGFEKWREKAHELDEKPIEQAAAEMSDELAAGYARATYIPGLIPLFGRIWRSPDHTDHAFKNFSANVSKEQKEIAAISTNSDYVIHELIAGLRGKDDDKVVGALQILAQQNDFNDMFDAMQRIKEETGLELVGEDGKPLDISAMSTENAKAAIVQMMKHAGLEDEEMQAKNLLNISNTAIAAGNVGMAGAARFNEDTHKFEVASEKDTATIAAVKLQNLETQARQRTLHHNAIFKQKTTRKNVKIKNTDTGEELEVQAELGDLNGLAGRKVLGTITSADIREAHRSRDDLKREIANRLDVLKYGTKEQKAQLQEMKDLMDSNQVLKEYFETIYAFQRGRDYQSQKRVTKDLKIVEEEPVRTPKGPDRSSTPFKEHTGPITLEK